MAYDHIKCPKCNVDFGQEKRFRDHLVTDHKISVEDHEALYIEIVLNSVKPTCACGCGEKTPWYGWKKGYTSKFVRGHNASVDSVYLDPERQKEFAQKRVDGFKSGRLKVWNDGLTKETDERIAQSAEKTSITLSEGYSSGSLVDWHLKDPEKSKIASAKQSETKRERFANGELIPWNKGLTKQTSEALARMAKGVSENYVENPDASAKRLTVAQLLERVDRHSDKFELVSDPTTYRNKYQKLEFRCKSCGKIQLKNTMMLAASPVCYACHPKESKAQLEIFEFVRSLAPDAISCDREVIKPKELDIYVPSHKLGIEYNGLYFHSVEVIPDQKHAQKKLEACHAVGVSLLSIFEDEWRDKRVLVESMITHRLSIPGEVFDARKMRLEEISSARVKEFFEANHLEGHARCTTAFGLIDPSSGRIIAAISLRRPFHVGHAEYLEVARSCTLARAHVRGWLGRLTKATREHAQGEGMKGLITYVDSRVGEGKSYEAAGWKVLKASTGPRFWWTDFHSRFNRFKYKADKRRGMTQADVADEAGVVMLYGCSNSLWVCV